MYIHTLHTLLHICTTLSNTYSIYFVISFIGAVNVGGRVVVKLFLLNDAPVDLNYAKSRPKKGKKAGLIGI